MGIRFKPVLRGNLSDTSIPAKYYALAKATRCVDNEELLNQISKKMCFSSADIAGAIFAIFETISSLLEEGKALNIKEFGSFRLSISGESTLSVEQLKQNNIKKINFIFRSNNYLKKRLMSIKFEKEKG